MTSQQTPYDEAGQELPQNQKGRPRNAEPVIRLSKDPAQAVKDVMGLIDNLKDTYIEETRLLQSGDSRAFLDLQDRKMKNVKEYQSAMRQLLVRKEEIKQVSPDLKEQLETMYKEFTELLGRNQNALKGMKKASQRLADIMLKAVKKEIEKQQTKAYKADGKMNDDKQRAISAGSISESV